MAYIARDGSVVETPRTSNHGSHEAVHGIPQPGPQEGKYPKWMHKTSRSGQTVSRLVMDADQEQSTAADGFSEAA